jgi:hypothetical protein
MDMCANDSLCPACEDKPYQSDARTIDCDLDDGPVEIPDDLYAMNYCRECLQEKLGIPPTPPQTNKNAALNSQPLGQRYGRGKISGG